MCECLGFAECVEALAAAGADVNLRTTHGCTPAWEAAYSSTSQTHTHIHQNNFLTNNNDRNADHEECLKALRRAGADFSIADNKGKTPLDVALHYGYTQCAEAIS